MEQDGCTLRRVRRRCRRPHVGTLDSIAHRLRATEFDVVTGVLL
jgi:hypothetical protein